MTKTEIRLRDTKGCLTDCVAFYFNVHPQTVPLFAFPLTPRTRWLTRLKGYFRRRRLIARWTRCTRVPSRGTHLVCGDSLAFKRYAHVVVYRNGRLAYDPQVPSRWSDRRITHRLVVTRMGFAR